MDYCFLMAELTVHYPDDLLLASGKRRAAFEDQLRFELAVRLFQVGQLSLGKAAELASLSKPRFGQELGRLKIPTINLDDSEIKAELSALRGSHHRGSQPAHWLGEDRATRPVAAIGSPCRGATRRVE